MPTNVEQFNRAVQRVSKQLPSKHLVPFQKKIVLDLLRGVSNTTPVDTGRARGGWQVTINTPPEGEVDRMDKSGNETVNAGLEALIGLGPFQVVWLGNNVAYIVPLETGHSKKAPAGMLAKNISRIGTQFRTEEAG